MSKVGVALAVYNSREQTRACLNALLQTEDVDLFVVVVDDGSTDGTGDMLRREFGDVVIHRGDGNLWWTGATNWAVRTCLESGCDSVVLLNPDVIVEPDTVGVLARESKALDDAIVSPVVLDFDSPELIWEAGHSWEPVLQSVPIFWVTRYLHKHGTPLSEIPKTSYKTTSVVGRGGLIPRRAFEMLGLFDQEKLPHYGADADMGLRAWRAGYPMYIVPAAKVRLHTKQTGRLVPASFRDALIGYKLYLTSRKHGEALRVLYHWNNNNLPRHIALPNYLFMLVLNTFRYWQRFLSVRLSHAGQRRKNA